MADQSSTLKVEDLEEGKRYKVSFEGVRRGDRIRGGGLAFEFSDYGLLPVASSIEPLPDPEPEWKHGTVVLRARHPVALPLTYDGGNEVWRWAGAGVVAHSADVSEAWEAGTLEILYQPSE